MGLGGSKVEDEVLAAKLKKRTSSLTEDEILEQQAQLRRQNSLAQVKTNEKWSSMLSLNR